MIAVDWGTSSLRAYRLGPAGEILERRSAEAGIMNVASGGFAAILERELGDWIDEPPIVMSGMIGSRQGWLEVPYADCPCDGAALARGLRPVRWGAGRVAWIVPGLACHEDAGIPDVMRGEETQILGAFDALPAAASICLPGTHSKWARIVHGRIAGFATAMTGEVFAVMREHSILGRLMPHGEAAFDRAAFAAGLARASEAGGLLHHLFGVRARGLFGEIAAAGLADYLSGILIGHEIAALAPPEQEVHLIGAPVLTARYAAAIDAAGGTARILDADCVARGLFRLAAARPRLAEEH